MKTGVCGTDYCDDEQLKNHCRREYGWRGEYQFGIDKKNNNGGREGQRWRRKQTTCPTDANYQKYPAEALGDLPSGFNQPALAPSPGTDMTISVPFRPGFA